MKQWFLVWSICLSYEALVANDALKKAFAEGIKVSVEVVKYEKEQAHKPIPQGYCVSVTGKEKPLDMWQEVKLESLALFLKLSPSLLSSTQYSGEEAKRILCLGITQERQKAVEMLEHIRKKYPKIEEYLSKVEILPTHAMHRLIPGVGEYVNDVEGGVALHNPQSPAQSLSGSRIVLLNKNQKSKTLFDSGSTRVIGSALRNVSYIERTVYKRRAQ